MSKKLTAAEVAAIDWQALLAKLPAIAALIAQLIALLNEPVTKSSKACPCPDEVKCCADEALCTLATHVLAVLRLHECCGCCEDE